MDLMLQGKTAFVSGSTQGIGYAIARQLLKEGAKVIINGRTPQKTNDAVKKLKEDVPNAEVHGIAADLASIEETGKLITGLQDIDILINNVGIFELKPFWNVNDDDWSRIFEINVMSGVLLTRSLLPKMLTKKWGRVIFISSESGINVPENMIHYGMTKTAMLSVSNGLSKLTKGTEVTVNTILGGPTYSDGVAAAVEQIAQMNNLAVDQMKGLILQNTNPHSLLQRFIDPTEIACLAAYLSSPLAVAINGASLRADGGVLKCL